MLIHDCIKLLNKKIIALFSWVVSPLCFINLTHSDFEGINIPEIKQCRYFFK